MKDKRPIEIHPQRCYECRAELKVGERALACVDFPVVFCRACREPNAKLQLAVVKEES